MKYKLSYTYANWREGLAEGPFIIVIVYIPIAACTEDANEKMTQILFQIIILVF